MRAHKKKLYKHWWKKPHQRSEFLDLTLVLPFGHQSWGLRDPRAVERISAFFWDPLSPLSHYLMSFSFPFNWQLEITDLSLSCLNPPPKKNKKTEHKFKKRRYELNCGSKPWTYWTINFLTPMLCLLVPVLVVVLIRVAVNHLHTESPVVKLTSVDYRGCFQSQFGVQLNPLEGC